MRKSRTIFYSPLFVIILGLLAALLFMSLFGMARKASEARRNKIAAERELEATVERETKLQAKIDRLSTQSGAEEALREKFSVKKEGEGEVVILDKKEETTASVGKTKKGFWEFLKTLFK